MIWVNVVQAQGRLMVISGCKRLRPGEEPLTSAEAVARLRQGETVLVRERDMAA